MTTRFKILTASALLVGGSQLAHSALISSATYNLDPTSVAADPDQDGVVDSPLSLTSITVDSTVYTDLTYGTATVNIPRSTFTHPGMIPAPRWPHSVAPLLPTGC